MGGLGLFTRRRAIASSPVEGEDIAKFLMARFSFEGRTNQDSDRTIAYETTGKGFATMKVQLASWTKDYGYKDDMFVGDGSSNTYGTITLAEPIGDNFTIIIHRELLPIDELSGTLLGSASSSSGQSTMWMEYKTNGALQTACRGGVISPTRIDSSVAWMTQNSYNGLVKEGMATTNSYLTTQLVIGKMRTGVAVAQKFKIHSIHIFNQSFSPNEIEKYIQKYIDSSYSLPV